MYKIPTELKWTIWGRTKDEQVACFDQCDTHANAEVVAQQFQRDRPDLVVTIEEYNAIIPDRTLPTPKQIQDICWILHGALVMIRNMGHADDQTDTMREIAEALHETPLEMFNPNSWDWNATLDRLRTLEKDYPSARTYGLAKRFEKTYRSA